MEEKPEVELKVWTYFLKGPDSEKRVVYQHPETGLYARENPPKEWLNSRGLISVRFSLSQNFEARDEICREFALEYRQEHGFGFKLFMVHEGNPVEVCRKLVASQKALEARPLLEKPEDPDDSFRSKYLEGLHRHRPKKYGRY